MSNSASAPPRTGDLLDLTDVLKRVPLSSGMWYRLISRGEAPKPVKIGRRSFWHSEDVDAFIASRKATGTAS